MFFKKDAKNDVYNDFAKIAALLIHAAKIDENYTDHEEEIIEKTLLEIGANKEKIKKIIEDSNIKFIDIKKEIFDKSEDPKKLFSIKNMGKYNEEGYKKIAEYIFKLTRE